jgi:hypothetical protein
VKIADFGIASLVGASGEKSGTPPYMAPEQEKGIVDRRGDIYALGAVLYEMLTGERPAKALVAPSRKVEVDVKIDEMVLRALEKEPERRYQTAGEFRTVVQTMAKPSKEPPPSAGDEQARPREAHGVPTGSGTPRIGGMKIKGYGDYNPWEPVTIITGTVFFSADAGLRGVFFRTGPMDAAHYWHSGIGHLRRVLCGVLAVSFTHFSGSELQFEEYPPLQGGRKYRSQEAGLNGSGRCDGQRAVPSGLA